jgi:hypothetical protein
LKTRFEEEAMNIFLNNTEVSLEGINLYGSYCDQGKLTLCKKIFIKVCKTRKVKLTNKCDIDLLTDKNNVFWNLTWNV